MKKHLLFLLFSIIWMPIYASANELDARPIIDMGKAEENLGYCITPKIQYGQYSSYDGGKSAIRLMVNECPAETWDFQKACEIKYAHTGNIEEVSKTCLMIEAAATQTLLKQFNK